MFPSHVPTNKPSNDPSLLPTTVPTLSPTDCVATNDNPNNHTIDVVLLLDLSTSLIDDINLFTFKMSQMFLFGGIKTYWTCKYGINNIQFCLLAYNTNVYVLENCTSTPVFLTNFHNSYQMFVKNPHDGLSINITNFINVTDESRLETSLYATMDWIVDNSFENLARTRLIISTLQFSIFKNERDICDNYRITNALELSQIHHILLQIENKNATKTQSKHAQSIGFEFGTYHEAVVPIECFISDDNLDSFTKESYYLFDLSNIQDNDNNPSTLNLAMMNIVDKFFNLYETLSDNDQGYILFQDVSAQKLPVFVASTSYGQIDDYIWLISGNVTIKVPTLAPTELPTDMPTLNPTQLPTETTNEPTTMPIDDETVPYLIEIGFNVGINDTLGTFVSSAGIIIEQSLIDYLQSINILNQTEIAIEVIVEELNITTPITSTTRRIMLNLNVDKNYGLLYQVVVIINQFRIKLKNEDNINQIFLNITSNFESILENAFNATADELIVYNVTISTVSLATSSPTMIPTLNPTIGLTQNACCHARDNIDRYELGCNQLIDIALCMDVYTVRKCYWDWYDNQRCSLISNLDIDTNSVSHQQELQSCSCVYGEDGADNNDKRSDFQFPKIYDCKQAGNTYSDCVSRGCDWLCLTHN